MKQKLLEMVQATVLFHTFPPLDDFFGQPKLGYKGGRALQLSAWGTLATSGAGGLSHKYNT